jgi:hypothetical protein
MLDLMQTRLDLMRTRLDLMRSNLVHIINKRKAEMLHRYLVLCSNCFSAIVNVYQLCAMLCMCFS